MIAGGADGTARGETTPSLEDVKVSYGEDGRSKPSASAPQDADLEISEDSNCYVNCCRYRHRDVAASISIATTTTTATTANDNAIIAVADIAVAVTICHDSEDPRPSAKSTRTEAPTRAETTSTTRTRSVQGSPCECAPQSMGDHALTHVGIEISEEWHCYMNCDRYRHRSFATSTSMATTTASITIVDDDITTY